MNKKANTPLEVGVIGWSKMNYCVNGFPPLNSLRYGEEFQPWMEFQLDSVLLGVEKQLAINGSLDFQNMVDFVFFKNNLSSTSILSMSAWEHMLPGL